MARLLLFNGRHGEYVVIEDQDEPADDAYYQEEYGELPIEVAEIATDLGCMWPTDRCLSEN